jgi:tetratricopeptide (TPR) repeat protein
MTCEDVSRNELVEKYLLNQLSDADHDSFEEHYFECARCFSLLQTYRDLQAELGRNRQAADVTPAPRRWVWQWAWVPAMAVVLIAASVTLWQRPGGEILPGRSGTVELSGSTPPPPPSSGPAPPTLPALDDLARFEPPPYAPPRLRGVGDEATSKFREAMTHYQRREYARAAAGLREAAALDPQAPHILYYLGVSQLLTADPDGAIGAFSKVVALGDSAYLEEAQFALAKAHLRKPDVNRAIEALEKTVALGGERQTEARRLLGELQKVRSP